MSNVAYLLASCSVVIIFVLFLCNVGYMDGKWLTNVANFIPMGAGIQKKLIEQKQILQCGGKFTPIGGSTISVYQVHGIQMPIIKLGGLRFESLK